MKNIRLVLTLATAFFCALLPASPAQSKEKEPPTPAQQRALLAKEVKSTIAAFKQADPGIDRFFKQSAAYVVFPRIGKVGLILGGGGGDSEVYEKGKLIGTASVSFLTVGLQAGAQEFGEIIFLHDAAALERFKGNKFEFSGNVSAVIIKAGASAGADYRDGVVVFTKPKGGAMLEASVGSQKFEFTPTPKAAPAKKK